MFCGFYLPRVSSSRWTKVGCLRRGTSGQTRVPQSDQVSRFFGGVALRSFRSHRQLTRPPAPRNPADPGTKSLSNLPSTVSFFHCQPRKNTATKYRRHGKSFPNSQQIAHQTSPHRTNLAQQNQTDYARHQRRPTDGLLPQIMWPMLCLFHSTCGHLLAVWMLQGIPHFHSVDPFGVSARRHLRLHHDIHGSVSKEVDQTGWLVGLAGISKSTANSRLIARGNNRETIIRCVN